MKPQSIDSAFSALALCSPSAHPKWSYPQATCCCCLYGLREWGCREDISKPGCKVYNFDFLLVMWGRDCRESEFVWAERNIMHIGEWQGSQCRVCHVEWQFILFSSPYFLKLLKKQARESTFFGVGGVVGERVSLSGVHATSHYLMSFSLIVGFPLKILLFLNKTIDWKHAYFQNSSKSYLCSILSCPKIIYI